MFNRGERVAILPDANSRPSEVLEIGTVLFAGPVYVQLMDGRMYDTETGRSLSSRKVSYIVAATPDHAFALRTQSQATGGLSVV
jgi:hypothetical protein